jgi:hypothetical protein
LKGKTLKVPYTFSYLRDENFCSRHSAPLLKPLGFVSPTVRGAKEGKNRLCRSKIYEVAQTIRIS